jgi:Spy/CpxP family protein refolding chaperone
LGAWARTFDNEVIVSEGVTTVVRTTLALIALTLALPIAASAQAAPAAPPAPPAPATAPSPGAMHQHHRSPYMTALRTLTLTPDQQQQIAGFMRDTKAANAGADKATKHANAKKLRAEIAGVLTPDQLTQLHAALIAQRPPVAAPAQ